MDTDQGSQYTGTGWITTLTKAEIKISMNGRRRCLDSILIEWPWWSHKQVASYLHEITDGFPAKRGINTRVEFHISKHPHTALDKLTPDDAYFDEPRIRTAA